MIGAATSEVAFFRPRRGPVSLKELQRRRFRVCDWSPDDGGLPGWQLKNGQQRWIGYAPRRAGEFIIITRSCDGMSAVVPRRWWNCDPTGMPRDDDKWAATAWRAIVQHYETQRNWYFGGRCFE